MSAGNCTGCKLGLHIVNWLEFLTSILLPFPLLVRLPVIKTFALLLSSIIDPVRSYIFTLPSKVTTEFVLAWKWAFMSDVPFTRRDDFPDAVSEFGFLSSSRSPFFNDTVELSEIVTGLFIFVKPSTFKDVFPLSSNEFGERSSTVSVPFTSIWEVPEITVGLFNLTFRSRSEVILPRKSQLLKIYGF